MSDATLGLRAVAGAWAISDLPPKWRKKIRCDGPETTACWEWTGAAKRPRRAYRAYHVPDDFSGFRHKTGSFVQERALPMLHDPIAGYPQAAHRLIFAHLARMQMSDVPRLQRCGCEGCVSPYHVVELGPVVKARPLSGALDILEQAIGKSAPATRPVLTGDVNAEQPLDTLKRVRPFSELSIESAEEECGLPPGTITPELWLEYVTWDAENE